MTQENELPDFDDLTELARTIGKDRTELLITEAHLSELTANITRTVTEDEKYWVAGRPPSNAYIKDSFHVLGYDEKTHKELATLTFRVAELKGKLEQNTLLMNVLRDMISVWRTKSANKRGAFLP